MKESKVMEELDYEEIMVRSSEAIIKLILEECEHSLSLKKIHMIHEIFCACIIWIYRMLRDKEESLNNLEAKISKYFLKKVITDLCKELKIENISKEFINEEGNPLIGNLH